MEDVIFAVTIFGGISCLLFSISPIGRAIADRIRSKGTAADTLAVRHELAAHREAMDQELDGVRRELAELAERVDFAERLLAKQRESERLVPPKG